MDGALLGFVVAEGPVLGKADGCSERDGFVLGKLEGEALCTRLGEKDGGILPVGWLLDGVSSTIILRKGVKCAKFCLVVEWYCSFVLRLELGNFGGNRVGSFE